MYSWGSQSIRNSINSTMFLNSYNNSNLISVTLPPTPDSKLVLLMGSLADLYYKSQTYFWTQWHFILLTLQTKLSKNPNWREIRFLCRLCLFSVNSCNAFCYLWVVKSCVNTYANIAWCRSKKGRVC